ncbi:acetyltransferase [Chitinophaga sp. RCC_12]|uniref:acetyltransferase n=1 Tax=Chitinophaga sp. RCC_12 TaxID=3239226 RepID=UPI003525F52D
MGKPLILIGGGGHAKSCIDIIEESGNFTIEGIIDVPDKLDSQVLGYRVIGNDNDIAGLIKQGYWFLITIGQIKSALPRTKIWQLLSSNNANIATVISPLSHVSKYAIVNKGSIIMHGAYINAGAVIGCNAIINTRAVIEHDSTIGDHCHISTGVLVNGSCKIGEEVFVGSGATINHGVSIVNDVRIGSGSLVHKNIKEPGTYIGVPFTRIA